MYNKEIILSVGSLKMKLFTLVLVFVWLKKVTPLYCKCTGGNCDIPKLDTCYTTFSCFTQTAGGNTSYGCIRLAGMEKLSCNRTGLFMTIKCCATDLCNSNGIPPKPYIPAPSVKLVKLAKRNVTVKINDSDGYRSKIDGYFITWYIPGDRSRHAQQLSPNKSLYTFGWLLLNTSYVIEVTSFKGRIASDRSKAIKIRTKSQDVNEQINTSECAEGIIYSCSLTLSCIFVIGLLVHIYKDFVAKECDFYDKGKMNGKKRESCSSFGCFASWKINGTSLELQQRGCWNDVPVSQCLPLSGYVFCICKNRKRCKPPNSKTFSLK